MPARSPALVCDPDPTRRRALCKWLATAGYLPFPAADASTALAAARAHRPALAMLEETVDPPPTYELHQRLLQAGCPHYLRYRKNEDPPEIIARFPSSTPTADRCHPEVVLPESGIYLDEVERSLIAQALKRSSGNRSAAARLLGISRYALRYRMKKAGISIPP
jgi:DNA-binding NtrC family response regulator